MKQKWSKMKVMLQGGIGFKKKEKPYAFISIHRCYCIHCFPQEFSNLNLNIITLKQRVKYIHSLNKTSHTASKNILKWFSFLCFFISNILRRIFIACCCFKLKIFEWSATCWKLTIKDVKFFWQQLPLK